MTVWHKRGQKYYDFTYISLPIYCGLQFSKLQPISHCIEHWKYSYFMLIQAHSEFISKRTLYAVLQRTTQAAMMQTAYRYLFLGQIEKALWHFLSTLFHGFCIIQNDLLKRTIFFWNQDNDWYWKESKLSIFYLVPLGWSVSLFQFRSWDPVPDSGSSGSARANFRGTENELLNRISQIKSVFEPLISGKQQKRTYRLNRLEPKWPELSWIWTAFHAPPGYSYHFSFYGTTFLAKYLKKLIWEREIFWISFLEDFENKTQFRFAKLSKILKAN